MINNVMKSKFFPQTFIGKKIIRNNGGCGFHFFT